MKGFIYLLAVSSLGWAAAPASADPSRSAVAYVQATIVTPDARQGTLSFVDASGRTRSYRAGAAVVPRLARFRPGDQVIVTLSSNGSAAVVENVRVASLTTTLAPELTSAVPEEQPPATTVVPVEQMRPSWPNPYSRFYRGPRPATRRR